MSKRSTKIICVTASVIAVLSMAVSSGCSGYFSANGLEGDVSISKGVESNGGFAVGTDNYVYFINGVESNTADNAYGTPVKGAVYRISKDNLNACNYSAVDKVVPLVAYTSNYDSGLFIYGDRIYYGTPSTAKNSEGEVQNSVLEMKSSKLDGTETMKNAYVSFPVTSYEYRYVEEGGTVYLLYVASDEKLYEESTGVTNLHSYNTATGADTLLAYDVKNVTFDAKDKTNPRVYYTMNVRDYTTDDDYGYNQLYTVTASATENKFADLSSETVKGWDDENDRYINCGNLVLDGIGSDKLNDKTVFNSDEEPNKSSYTYTPAKYVNGTLFYTRTGDTKREYLFSLKDGEKFAPVADNPDTNDRILTDGSNAKNYEYLFDGEGKLSAVLYAESAGISINKVDSDGKLHVATDLDGSDEYFKIVDKGTATLLTVDEANKWLYYSVSGGNGYSINRVDYTGTLKDYKPMPAGETDKTPVKILDLDADSAWYKPEFIAGHLLFASETANMTEFNYVMAFKLAGLSNGDIRALNDKYEGVAKHISETYGDTEKYPDSTYKNLQTALTEYAFYAGDYDYLKELAEACNAKVEKGEDLVYSDATLAEYEKFLNPAAEGNDVWTEYADVKKVNGKDVYANVRDYYYAVLGEMTEADKEAYMENLHSKLVAYPEEETASWYEGLSDGEKAGFIVGMVALGLLVIAGATVLTVFLIKRKKKNDNAPVRRRIKVDTTDDKDIDVYADEQ